MKKSLNLQRSHEAHSALRHAIPGGVTSSMRRRSRNLLFKNAEGGCLIDLDGNRYVDCVMGFGPIVIGHDEPAVRSRLHEQVDAALISGAETPATVNLVKRMRDWIPCAEHILFLSTGSEAVHMALRIARATTGRTKVLRFEGHYHGWIDPAYTNGMGMGPVSPDQDPLPIRPNSAGQLNLEDQIVVGRWNDIKEFDQLIAKHGEDLAAIIMEPVAFNFGGGRAYPGYLEHVREVCTRKGIILIFDEVVCGFRLRKGGAHEMLNVTPDMATFAKAIGSGIPIAMITGTKAAMACLLDGRVSVAGTYNGNALSIAAADATTALIETIPDFYEALEKRGAWLAEGLRKVADDLRIPVTVNQTGSVVCVFWGAVGDGQTFASCSSSDGTKIAVIMERLLDYGVYALARGTFFLCYRHTEEDLQTIIDGFREAVRQLQVEGILPASELKQGELA